MIISAIIVTYNPELELLSNNISSIINQVDKLYLYDNNSYNVNDIECKYNKYKKIHIIKSSVNNGIAKAVNDCVKLMNDEDEWFLTLDQDSICPDNIISEYSKYMDIENVSLMAPRVHTMVGRIIQNNHSYGAYEYIHRCITSACFVNRKAFIEIGGMDEQMFIDWVDHDLCKHFDITGWKIIQCNNIELQHNLGSSKPVHSSQLLNKVIHSKVIYQAYSPFRIYHMIRNTIYYMRKYKKFICYSENKVCLKFIIYHVVLKSIIVGEEKFEIFKSIYHAFIDGFKMNVDIKKRYI